MDELTQDRVMAGLDGARRAGWATAYKYENGLRTVHDYIARRLAEIPSLKEIPGYTGEIPWEDLTPREQHLEMTLWNLHAWLHEESGVKFDHEYRVTA